MSFAGLKQKKAASICLRPFDNLFTTFTYIVLRLLSQLTKPTPMLPSMMAPGAGITVPSRRNAAIVSVLTLHAPVPCLSARIPETAGEDKFHAAQVSLFGAEAISQ